MLAVANKKDRQRVTFSLHELCREKTEALPCTLASSPEVDGVKWSTMDNEGRSGCRSLWTPSQSWPGPIREGNPQFGSRMQLVSDTGFYLAIMKDKQVKGIDEVSNFTILDVIDVDFGLVQLYGVESKLYLAMNEKGLLYGEEDPSERATYFLAGNFLSYNTYQSQKHGWYVGIRKNGTAKPGPQTKRAQKAAHFMPKRLQ